MQGPFDCALAYARAPLRMTGVSRNVARESASAPHVNLIGNTAKGVSTPSPGARVGDPGGWAVPHGYS